MYSLNEDAETKSLATVIAMGDKGVTEASARFCECGASGNLQLKVSCMGMGQETGK